MVASLPESAVSKFRAAQFTYAEVGATAGSLPPGYRHLQRSRTFPSGEFEASADRLMHWQVHESAGPRVAASDSRVGEGGVVEMFLGPRWLDLRAVCRVVHVIEEPNRIGFAYGTLPGHAVVGEESFILERRDGVATFTIRAFSRPVAPLARLGGPVTGWAQGLMAERYLKEIGAEGGT